MFVGLFIYLFICPLVAYLFLDRWTDFFENWTTYVKFPGEGRNLGFILIQKGFFWPPMNMES